MTGPAGRAPVDRAAARIAKAHGAGAYHYHRAYNPDWAFD
jgi:hypothetical protein